MEWLPFVTVNNVNSNCHLAARLEIFLYKITGFRYNKKKEYNKTNEERGKGNDESKKMYSRRGTGFWNAVPGRICCPGICLAGERRLEGPGGC